jgi:hypothetical protein
VKNKTVATPYFPSSDTKKLRGREHHIVWGKRPEAANQGE